MRKVIVNEFMSIDGVVQAPGGVDEDTTGSFEHGGWHLGCFDELSQQRVLEGIVDTGGFLLGRRTSWRPTNGTSRETGVLNPVYGPAE